MHKYIEIRHIYPFSDQNKSIEILIRESKDCDTRLMKKNKDFC